jgi:hypothetical protein
MRHLSGHFIIEGAPWLMTIPLKKEAAVRGRHCEETQRQSNLCPKRFPHRAVNPPSITNSLPVTNDASSDARYRTP